MEKILYHPSVTVVASTKEYRELKAAFVVEMSVMDDDNDYLADYDKLKNLKTSPREKFQC